jgi:periplasmic nitrate reductase NapD
MRIVSLVLRLKPEDFASTREALTRIPGAELAHEDAASGRQIITLEDGEGYSVADSIIAVHQIPSLMSVTLAYEFADDNQALTSQEITP